MGKSRHHLFNTRAFRSLRNEVNSSSASIDKIRKKYDKLFSGFGVRIASFGDSIKNAFAPLGKVFTPIINGFKKIIGLALKFSGALLALGGVVGSIALIKNAFSVSKLGNDIDKTSQKVGMSTKTYQKWSYILERCGVEASNLKTAMRGLTSATLGNNGEYFK